MSEYTERVARSLEGLEAVSTGVCSGCDECREAFDYVPDEECDREPPLPAFFVRGLPEPTVYYTTEAEALKAAREAFDDDVSSGHVFDEGGFSWSGCGICGSSLGGTMESWHGVDAEGRILHFDDACVDCVVYLANGDEPERD